MNNSIKKSPMIFFFNWWLSLSEIKNNVYYVFYFVSKFLNARIIYYIFWSNCEKDLNSFLPVGHAALFFSPNYYKDEGQDVRFLSCLIYTSVLNFCETTVIQSAYLVLFVNQFKRYIYIFFIENTNFDSKL